MEIYIRLKFTACFKKSESFMEAMEGSTKCCFLEYIFRKKV